LSLERSQKHGFGIRDPVSEIRDPGSGKTLFRIPDPGVKKTPDPGSESATLSLINTFVRMTASHMVLSTESLSSGYGSDSFLPVSTETMDTEDYELWERRQVALNHRLNMELDLRSLFGLLCTAVLG
jgi:hypothetical protein